MADFTESQYTLLVVDDTPQNIDILVEALGDKYSLMVATDGTEALEAVEEHIPDLILLDIMMPEMDGFEVCSRLKKDSRFSEIPVIFLTAMTDIDQKERGFEIGAVDYITKPFDIREVELRVNTQLEAKLAREFLSNRNQILEEIVKQRTRKIEETQSVTIRMAASLAETRDNETGHHIIRTQAYVKCLAEKMAESAIPGYKLSEKEIALLVQSAPLHDIGKVGVPDRILLKQGKLDDDEFDIMKKHTVYGMQALKKAEEQIEEDSFLKTAREIAYTHHEKWNGSGYPEGIEGDSIPLSGRIMAIADVYDALICKRVYKPPMPHSKACSIIEEGAGSHFDPRLVEIFHSIKDEFRKIALNWAETKEEREALNR